MNLFGRKKPAPPKLNDSIQSLRRAMDVLEKREKHLDKQASEALEAAKAKSKAKDRRGALYHLKRKKMIDKQVEQIYGKRGNLEMQIHALEAAASNKELLRAMKQGSSALQAAVKAQDVDDVADVMDNISEAINLGDELSEAMAMPLGPMVDEDELADELEDLEQELMDEELLKTPALPEHAQLPESNVLNDAPQIPTNRIPAAKSQVETAQEKEQRELDELDMLMNA